MKIGDLRGRDLVDRMRRVDTRAPERFVGVNVADPRDHPLIKEQRLYSSPLLCEERLQRCDGEACVQWFDSLIGEEGWVIWVEGTSRSPVVTASNEGQAPECTHVAEAHLAPVGEFKPRANVGVDRV
jgi:hypothetical protein